MGMFEEGIKKLEVGENREAKFDNSARIVAVIVKKRLAETVFDTGRELLIVREPFVSAIDYKVFNGEEYVVITPSRDYEYGTTLRTILYIEPMRRKKWLRSLEKGAQLVDEPFIGATPFTRQLARTAIASLHSELTMFARISVSDLEVHMSSLEED